MTDPSKPDGNNAQADGCFAADPDGLVAHRSGWIRASAKPTRWFLANHETAIAIRSLYDPINSPVLLCGGSGTRLWPLSRKSYPKQFVKLTGDESLYQASARRLSGAGFAAPTIVTAADFRFIVIEQLAALEIAPADILIEPSAKNTAAAICAAALGA